MNITVYPEGMFRLDFDAILDGAKRQEKIHSSNLDEYKFAKNVHMFFDSHVLRLIMQNEWVFKSAGVFAEEFSIDCFRYLKTASIEIYRIQKELENINSKVITLINNMAKKGAIKTTGILTLVKASDFLNFVDLTKLDINFQQRARLLFEEASEHEDIQIWVTLRAIRDLYEIILPRVMYVVRRVIKVMNNIEISPKDNLFSGISTYLDWYETKVSSSHALYPVLRKLRPFFKIARNVASHHEGLQWDPKNNLVILKDKNDYVKVHTHEFQQNYRYLLYICDFGIRGILCGFCGRERGAISNEIVKKYVKTFPEDFPEGISGRVKYYVI